MKLLVRLYASILNSSLIRSPLIGKNTQLPLADLLPKSVYRRMAGDLMFWRKTLLRVATGECIIDGPVF